MEPEVFWRPTFLFRHNTPGLLCSCRLMCMVFGMNSFPAGKTAVAPAASQQANASQDGGLTQQGVLGL